MIINNPTDFSHLFAVAVTLKSEIGGSEKKAVSDLKIGNAGFLGRFKKGDELVITIIALAGDHACFTLDPRNLQPVKKASVGEGVYEKHLTVTDGKLVAPWPSNMICLTTGGRSFNVGIFVQYDVAFLAVEEYIPNSPEKTFLPGEVKWFSLLRGIGAVASENILIDLRIHWKKIIARPNGLRFLQTGERLTNINTVETAANRTNFQKEVVGYKLA